MAVQAAFVRLFRKLRHVETYRRQGFKRLLNGHEFGRLISLVRLGCAMDDLNCPARIPHEHAFQAGGMESILMRFPIWAPVGERAHAILGFRSFPGG